MLYSEPLVLLHRFLRQLFPSWEIQLEQDQVLAGVFLELRFGKNFLFQHDAPAAPVGTGEIHQEQLVLRFCFLLGLRVIRQPPVLGGSSRFRGIFRGRTFRTRNGQQSGSREKKAQVFHV
jgi:hypothetical protein